MNYVSLNVFVHLELVHGSRLFKTKNSFIKLNPLIFLYIISAIHEILKQDTILPKPLDSPEVPIRDHDDLLIPASALAGGAEVLVTGDKELLALGSIYNLEIISPRQFWEKIAGQQSG